jgi:chromosomal replication initiator protein
MSQNPIEIWERVLSGLQKEISSASFETWFSKTDPLKLEDQSLVVAVPDSFTKGGIARRYQALVAALRRSTYTCRWYRERRAKEILPY